MRRIHVAVVGFGRHFAKHHLPRLAANENVEILAISEVLNKQWVHEQLSKYDINVPVYTSTEDRDSKDIGCIQTMLADYGQGGIDAVIAANIESPLNSADERLQIWGTQGMLTLDRFKPRYDNEPAKVTFQRIDGTVAYDDLKDAVAKAWAPSEAFLNLLTADSDDERKDARLKIVSTGAHSLETVRILENIYLSNQIDRQIEFSITRNS